MNYMEKQKPEDTIALLKRIIDIFDVDNDGPGTDSLWWRTDGDHCDIYVLVNCNDLFVWGCADCEEITADNIDLLASTIKEMYELEETLTKDNEPRQYKESEFVTRFSTLLWVARYRKCRPQVAYYKCFHGALKPLFDACGLEEHQYGSEAYYDKIEADTGKKLEWRTKHKV